MGELIEALSQLVTQAEETKGEQRGGGGEGVGAGMRERDIELHGVSGEKGRWREDWQVETWGLGADGLVQSLS